MTLDSLALIIVVSIAPLLMVGLGLYRRREGILYHLRRLIITEVTYVAVAAFLIQTGSQPVVAILAGVVGGFVVDRLFIPRRSRYVRASERRKAIARHQAKSGERFDGRRHHLHHKVPFSKGGSNTADNLEVLQREKNLARGAKPPWWDVIGHIFR
jgi:hypothetical protein